MGKRVNVLDQTALTTKVSHQQQLQENCYLQREDTHTHTHTNTHTLTHHDLLAPSTHTQDRKSVV